MLSLIILLGCSEKDNDTAVEAAEESREDAVEESSFDCTQDYALCSTLSVPSDFTGTPRNLSIVLYSEIPPQGPPSAVLDQIDAPDIGLDKDYILELHPITATGEYHLYISLYMEGGGTWMPESGIDYSLYTEKITFDGSAVDLGNLELLLTE